MAKQFNVPLVGMKSRTETARIGKEVVGFISTDKKFAVVRIGTDNVSIKTAKGTYTLLKHASANRFEGTCAGIRVHVVLNKIVGKVIYWVK